MDGGDVGCGLEKMMVFFAVLRVYAVDEFLGALVISEVFPSGFRCRQASGSATFLGPRLACSEKLRSSAFLALKLRNRSDPFPRARWTFSCFEIPRVKCCSIVGRKQLSDGSVAGSFTRLQ